MLPPTLALLLPPAAPLPSALLPASQPGPVGSGSHEGDTSTAVGRGGGSHAAGGPAAPVAAAGRGPGGTTTAAWAWGKEW